MRTSRPRNREHRLGIRVLNPDGGDEVLGADGRKELVEGIPVYRPYRVDAPGQHISTRAVPVGRLRVAAAVALALSIMRPGSVCAAGKPDATWGREWVQVYEIAAVRGRAGIEAAARGDAHRAMRGRQRDVGAASEAGGSEKGELARIAARKRITEHLRRIRKTEQANAHSVKIVAEFPGRVGLAIEQFGAILRSPGKRWGDYAARRVVALHQAGLVPGAHAAVVLAYKSRAARLLSRGRLAEADMALAALEAIMPSDTAVRAQRGLLLLRAGRDRDAYKRFEGYGGGRVSGVYIRTYANRLERKFGVDTGPAYPRRLGDESKAEMLLSRPLLGQGDFAASLLDAVADRSSVIAWDRERCTSVWREVVDHLLRQGRGPLAAWRAFQQRRAGPILAAAQDTGAMAAFRRWPDATAAHRLLIDWGEKLLRRGHVGIAMRCFEDLLTHATDRTIRARAQAGLWLAAAQDASRRLASPGARAVIEAAFEGVPAGAVYPWMGKAKPAADIRRKLLASVDTSDTGNAAPTAAALKRRQRLLKQLPSGRTRRRGQVLRYGRQLLVASGGMLARIDGRTLAPAWSRTPSRDVSSAGAPAPPTPAVADGRVYCRWHLGRESTPSVAAFDLRTGKMLWSTALQAAWREHTPTSDPAAADGRVYTLGVRQGFGRTGAGTSISLFCQDATDGRTLWRRRLANQDIDYRSGGASLVQYGAAVTVDRGAVYCSTSMSFVARCDGRDGMLEWARTYQRDPVSNSASLKRRRANPPIVVGDRAIYLPRDTGGLFAVDRRNGKLLWDCPFAPSVAAVGVRRGLLLTVDDRSIAAVDIDSGAVRWVRRLGDRIRGKAALVGDSVYLAGAGGVSQVAVSDGSIRARTPWSSAAMSDFVVRDGEVIGIGPLSFGGGPGGPIPAPPAPVVKLPLARSWHLDRAGAVLAAPPARAKIEGLIYVRSPGKIECISPADKGAVKWQAPMPKGYTIQWAPKLLLAVYPGRTAAYDALTGEKRPVPAGARLRGRSTELKDLGPTVTVASPAARGGSVQCSVPVVLAGPSTVPRILSYSAGPDLVTTLASSLPARWHKDYRGPATPARLRVDAFDRTTGTHLVGREIGLSYTPGAQALWRDSMLIIADKRGVDAYSPSAKIQRQVDLPVEMIHRGPAPARIDAVLDDWRDDLAVGPTRGWATGRSLMLTHDGWRLYLAVTFDDAGAASRVGSGDYDGGDCLEIGLGQYRFIVASDDNGRIVLEDLRSGPSNRMALDQVKAAVRHDLARGTITYEVAVPFGAFGGGRNVELSVTAWDDLGPRGRRASLVFGRGRGGGRRGARERFYFDPRTRTEEEACMAICRRAPGLEESLMFIQRYYRARAPDNRRRRKFHSQFIEATARGPLALRAMAMLDNAMRPTGGGDPMSAVLEVARRAGVPDAVRRKYADFTKSYLSFWAYTNGRVEDEVFWHPKLQLVITLDDGRPGPEGRDHRYSWYAKRGLGPYNRWVHLQIPLIRINMHDRAIHGMSFFTHFGSYLALDRVAVIRDGKEHVFIDDAFPPGRASGRFRWKGIPAKSGSKSFGSTVNFYSGNFSVSFDKPITAHLASRSTKPMFDAERAIPVLRENIPRLNGSMDGWRFFLALLRAEAGDDVDKRIALFKWYLKVNPRSPRVGEALIRLLKYCRQRKKAGALAEVEAVIADAGIDPRIAYAFRSNHAYFGRMFVRDWLVLGPIGDAVGDDKTDVPGQSGKFDLQQEYAGMVGKVMWKPFNSKADLVDFNATLTKVNRGNGYALSWIYSEKTQPAILEFGMDSTTHVWSLGQAWLDGELVLTAPRGRLPGPGMVSKKVILQAGWNELLVKIAKPAQGGRWAFWMEVIDPEGRGLPKGVKFSTTQP